ncbi:serine/threonine protein kinase [Penicillium macrosclerotiorum]|uniref:serine/threonine protein kinase n=1 Tax=Penicillium macrosclerotiorum TaxID=303699 RepID=UPI0025479138|nr:serine/threonine protein kinase [Penicillium macrosclerotiorum]KAJ5666702.1 serine/threonine protein kinase [Penicillium macrosclerotiorum]
MYPLLLDPSGHTIPNDMIIGTGGYGVVIRENNEAIKLPLRHSGTTAERTRIRIRNIHQERDAYGRIGIHDGVVPFLGATENTIRLQFMPKKDLSTYLENCGPSPPKSIQLSWILQMARTLEFIHSRRVLICDIACRNMLLDSQMNLRFCDFGKSKVLPMDTCMETVNLSGYSIHTDIGQLGSAIYQVVTRAFVAFLPAIPDIITNKTSRWPAKNTRPKTDGIWMGEIIDKCWTKGSVANVGELVREIETFAARQDKLGTSIEVGDN